LDGTDVCGAACPTYIAMRQRVFKRNLGFSIILKHNFPAYKRTLTFVAWLVGAFGDKLGSGIGFGLERACNGTTTADGDQYH
jgi:hypothetical protein